MASSMHRNNIILNIYSSGILVMDKSLLVFIGNCVVIILNQSKLKKLIISQALYVMITHSYTKRKTTKQQLKRFPFISLILKVAHC